MPRTSNDLVAELLAKDWDPDISLTPAVITANSLTTEAYNCAARKQHYLDDPRWELIERWLAAYFYCLQDPKYASRAEAGVITSGTFQGQTGKYGEINYYGHVAMSLDTSGCLKGLLMGNRTDGAWLGKPPSQQIPITHRD